MTIVLVTTGVYVPDVLMPSLCRTLGVEGGVQASTRPMTMAAASQKADRSLYQPCRARCTVEWELGVEETKER